MDNGLAAAAGSVPVEPNAIRETIHTEYVRALDRAISGVEMAVDWGRSYRTVPGSQLDDLNDALATIKNAYNDATSPKEVAAHG